MNTKKILTALLTGALAVATMTVAAMACETSEEAVSTWDGETYCTEWLESGTADGVAGDVYYLNSAADLAGLSKVLYEWYPGNTNNPFQDDTFYLTVDIDLGNHEWIPIGTASNSKGVEKGKWFGSFDGQGHTISNLKVTGDFQHAGLFGYTGGATQKIENIVLENVTIDNNVTSKPATGALVGRINSNTFVISNVDVTGTVDIEGSQFTGGIAGYGRGQIVDCDVTATGTIHNSLNDVGGIVGIYYATSNDTYVKDCTVNGGKDGLVVSTDYGMIGGAIGFVSPGADVTKSVVDNVCVENVKVIDASGEASACIAYGYTATNSIAAKVEVVDSEDNEIVPEDAAQTKAVASVNGEYFTDLASAFKSVSEKATIEILSDVTIDAAWQCNFGRGFDVGTFNNNEVTINGNNHVIKFTGKMTDGNTEGVISTGAPITVNDLTFDLSECPSYRRIIAAKTSAVINNCTFIGNPANTKTSYAVIVGESGGDQLANTTLTVTGSDFDNFSYGVSDNRNGQDIKSVTVTDSEFTNAKVLISASESITFNKNVMDNGSVNITSYSEDIKLAVEMKNNTLDATADNKIQKCAELDTDETEGIILPTITVGNVKYSTFAQALAAADEGDTIYVAPGRYTEKLALTKNVVITGDPNYGTTGAALAAEIEKPVIVISEVADGGVKYQATDVTFDNIVFEVAEDATRTGGYYACALGYFVEDNKTRNTLTVTNCDFINHSSVSGLIAIMAHIPNYTVTDCTFTNFSTGIYTALDNSEMGNVVVSDNTFANVAELYSGYWGKENAAASLVIDNNKASDDSTTVISVFDYVKNTVGADATAYGTFAVTDNDAKVILTNATADVAAKATGNDEVVYTYTSETLMRALDRNLPNGTVYVAYGTVDQQMFIVENGYVKTEATSVSLTFEENNDDATALDNSVWDIYLNANQGGILNRLNSADFTFEITTDGKDAMAYEICATNDEIVINNVNNDANRYEFHYDGKTGTITDTATKIKLGTVKFTGYGAFTFSVDTTEVAENTNQVHATTFVDSIVDSFTVKGEIAVADDNGDLVVNGDNGIINSEIIVPTKVLTINIDFPNSVSDNAVAYQQMKVVVSGGELEAPLTIDLGTDYVVSELDIYDNKANAEVTVTKNNPYAIVITNLLEVNTAYNVEVSGEGYRTAKYTVTMTEDKTLNFWNNVKDNAVNVEEKKDSSAKNVTFLAGDIVKDSVINIYDLSAVVSYFGEIDLVEDGMTQYAKYDLNRDGKIDSKDVAYVLVSWGK